jgi:hypothetical protein
MWMIKNLGKKQSNDFGNLTSWRYVIVEIGLKEVM